MSPEVENIQVYQWQKWKKVYFKAGRLQLKSQSFLTVGSKESSKKPRFGKIITVKSSLTFIILDSVENTR